MKTPNATIRGTTYNYAGGDPSSVVSIGSKGSERQLINVAAGQISETSTDAINGSQLYALQTVVNALNLGLNLDILSGDSNIIVTNTTNPDTGVKNYTITLNPDIKLNTGSSNVAPINTDVTDDKKNIVVTKTVANDGTESYTVNLNKDVVVNTISSEANKADPNTGFNLSDNGLVYGGKTYVSNDGLNANNNKIINVSNGEISKASTDAINGSQLYETNQNVSINSQNIAEVKKGVENNTKNITEVKQKVDKGLTFVDSKGNTVNKQLGDTMPIVGKTVNGHANIITEVNESTGGLEFSLNDTLQVSTIVTNEGDVKVDNSGLTIKNGPTVTKDGVNAGNKVVKNVADGEISETSTEAVNGSQIYNIANYLNNKIETNSNSQVNNRINKVENDIGRLNDKIDRNDKRYRKGIAISGAMALVAQATLPGKSMISAAATNYRSEQALVVGYSRLSDNGKHIIKLNGSTNVSGKKDVMTGVAYGYQW